MVSALMSTSGTPPGGCLIKINRSSGHPWKYAFVMSHDLTVRRSHETHERRMFNPSMSQVGESVLTRAVSSRSPRLTNRLLNNGAVITLATEKLFGRGQDDDVSVMGRRSFKLPMKIAGSNNGETQALEFAGESLWLAWLAWSEMHGAPMRRWHLDETIRQVAVCSSQILEVFLMP